VWVDDPHFDLNYHVRHTALPAPGDDKAFTRLMGRLMSQPLDRDWIRTVGPWCSRSTTRWSTASPASSS
jgi:hypothetical protein